MIKLMIRARNPKPININCRTLRPSNPEAEMPTLTCYVDDRTFAILQDFSGRLGRTVEDLAEAAISDAAVRASAQDEAPAPTLPLEAEEEEHAACDECGEEHPVGVLDGGLCPACVDLDDEYNDVRRSGGLLP